MVKMRTMRVTQKLQTTIISRFSFLVVAGSIISRSDMNEEDPAADDDRRLLPSKLLLRAG